MHFTILISKSYNKFTAIHWVVTILTVMMTVVLYPRLPNEVPTHFGFGTAGSPANKIEIFILPLILIVFGVVCSRKWIDRQYADLTIQNTFIKTLMVVLMVLVWWAAVTALTTYYQLAW